MAQALYHAYSSFFTLSASSSTLPAFFVGNTDVNHALSLKKYRISMAGTGGASVLVQVVTNAAASAAGTSTAGTISQVSGRTIANLGIAVCGYNYTVTRGDTYAIIEEFWLANNGTIVYDYPPGDEPDCIVGVASSVGAGFGVLFTSGTPVSSSVSMWVSRT